MADAVQLWHVASDQVGHVQEVPGAPVGCPQQEQELVERGRIPEDRWTWVGCPTQERVFRRSQTDQVGDAQPEVWSTVEGRQPFGSQFPAPDDEPQAECSIVASWRESTIQTEAYPARVAV